MQKFSHLMLLCALMFLSCTKNDVKPSGTQNQQTITAQADDISDTEASPGLYHNAVTGASTLILQPGTDGNDLWFKNWDGHPYYATVCDTDVRLVKALAWKLEGTLIRTRSVIKFDGLSKIPSGSQVVSATLYLYGPSPKAPDVKQHLPMGNSSYPGSANDENTSYLQRITSSWNKQTICWNNQPSTTTADQVRLAPSTQQWNYNIAADVTNLVKPMVQDPAKNYGFMFKLETESILRSVGFFSSEYAVSAKRPRLVIEYN